MKKLKTRQLIEFDKQTKNNRLAIYRQLLGNVISRYASFLVQPSAGAGYLRSQRYDLLLQWGKLQSVQSYSDDPDGDSRKVFVRSQVAALIKKYPWTYEQSGIDAKAVAKANFLRTEAMCRRMNKILNYTIYTPLLDARPQTRLIRDLIPRMRGFIEYVLGEEPDMERVYAQCDFTGGSNVGCTGDKVHLAKKLLAVPTCTPGAYDMASAAIMAHAQYADVLRMQLCPSNSILLTPQGSEPFLVLCQDNAKLLHALRKKVKFLSYNKIEFVDKTADTDRVIAKEPILNTYIQKGFDAEMRLRLKRVGIDLSNQDLNKRLAQRGSFRWFAADTECTVDLTNASDLNCTELVRLVFPEEWFRVLNKARSKYYELDGEIRKYEKFTSSGNGFCFPVESLIFASILFACGVRNFGTEAAVYGDDLIMKKRFYAPVIQALKALGFVPNEKKSFSEGPFRESCGGDFYAGEDIRPYTLDYELDSLSALFKFLNLTQRNRSTKWFFNEERIRIFRSIPVELQFVRPFDGPCDTGINKLGFEPTHPNVRYNRHTMSVSWRELSITPKIDDEDFPPWIVYAAAMRGHTPIGMFAYKRQTRTRVRRANPEGDVPHSPEKIRGWWEGAEKHPVPTPKWFTQVDFTRQVARAARAQVLRQ